MKGQPSLSSPLNELGSCLGDLWRDCCPLYHLRLQQVAAHSLQVHTALTPVPLAEKRENETEREKQALSSLPHSSNRFTGNFTASRALYDNLESSSALMSATKVHLRFSLSTIFLNNVISAANYTFTVSSPLGDRRTQARHTSPAALFTRWRQHWVSL